MGAFFGSAGMLWWGAAISVPILIHLFARQRFRRVPWAAMEFLLRAYKKTRRRIRLEHLLLLLLRILAIALFVMALADPRIEGSRLLGGGSDGPRNVVAIVDTSFSMGAKLATGGTPFGQAQAQASRLMRSLKRERGDTVTYITAGKPATPVLLKVDDPAKALAEVERTEVEDGATDLAGALRIALAALDGVPKGAEVFLFTDAQRVAFLPGSAARPAEGGAVGAGGGEDPADRPQQVLLSLMQEIEAREATITLITPPGAADDNVAVSDIRPASKVVATGVPAGFSASITNFGRRAQGGAVHFHVDGGTKPVEIVPLDLIAPGRPETVTFRHVFRLPGSHYVEARFLTDNLEVDNRRSVSLEVREKVRVLLVDGDPSPEPAGNESYYLSRALDPGGDDARPGVFAVETIEETALDLTDLRKFDLVALLNVGLVSPAAAGALQEYVEGGGGLVLFLGGRTKPEILNSLLWRGGQGILPARIAEVEGQDRYARDAVAFELQVCSFDHPVLHYFEDPRIRPFLVYPPFYRFYRTEVAADDPSVKVLASFDQKRAGPVRPGSAIVEKLYGAGRTILVTTTADDGWNDLPSFPTFVVLNRELALYLVTRSFELENLGVSAIYSRVIRSFAREVVVSREGEQLQVVRPLALEDEKGYEIRLAPFVRAGVYRLDLSGADERGIRDPSPLFVSVNVDTQESDLSRLAEEELASSFPGIALRIVPELDAEAEAGRPGESQNLWWWALAAALGLLVVETALSQLFGLRSRGAE